MNQKVASANKYEQRQILSIVRVRAKSIADLFLEYDEERIKNLSISYTDHVLDAIQRNGGYLYQKLDHDIIAIFASDLNADKHPLKAIKAGQAIFADTHIANELEIRVCVDTGECLTTRDSDGTTQSIVGDPLLSSSLLIEDIAPCSLAVTKQTMNYVGPHNFLEMGHRLFQYAQLKKVVIYLDPRPQKRLTPFPEMPFLGRKNELRFLNEKEKGARITRHPEYVYISGAPGIGKTRLIKKFVSSTTDRRIQIQFSFLPETHLHNDFLKRVFSQILTFIGLQDVTASENLMSYLAHYFSINDQTHLLALREFIYGINDGASWKALEIRTRRFVCASLVTYLIQKISETRPMSLAFENTHWADANFFIFINLLTAAKAPSLLVILTSRTQQDDNIDYSIFQNLEIPGWGIDDLKDALHIALGDTPYQDELSHLLQTKFAGNPLYTYEIFRMISLKGLKNKSQLLAIFDDINTPFTLQSIIEQQMLLLDTESRNTLCLLSTLGPKPRQHLFETCFGDDIPNYKQHLNQLEKSGFVATINSGLNDYYAFSHELVRQSVYQTIIPSQRKNLHRKIYKGIKNLKIDDTSERTKMLAYHSYFAEMWYQAYKYNYLLACASRDKFDLLNASKHFSICLDCNQYSSRNDESQTRRKIALKINIAKNIFMLADFTSMKDTMNKIEDLIHQSYVSPRMLYQYAHVKSAYNWIMGDYKAVIFDIETQLKSARISITDKISYLIKLGSIYSDIGKYQLSNKYYEQALQELESGLEVQGSSIHTIFPALGICYSMMARNFSLLDQPDDSIRNINRALHIADSQKSPSSIIFILCFCAEAFIHNKMLQDALPLAEKAHRLSQTYGIDILLSYIKSLVGYIRSTTSHDDATDLNLAAIKLALSEDRKCRLSMHYYYLGMIHAHQNKSHLAQKQFLQAWHLARRYNEQGYELLILRELVRFVTSSLRRDILQARIDTIVRELGLFPVNPTTKILAYS